MRFAYPLFCMHGKARERRRLIWRCLTIATQNHLLNEEIREPEVRLISEEGEQLGVMSGEQALRIAEEREMDLVLISPQAKPPVCKIMDYGKFRFEQTKKEKEARKNQRIIEIKEIRMSPGIGENDFNTRTLPPSVPRSPPWTKTPKWRDGICSCSFPPRPPTNKQTKSKGDIPRCRN